MTTTIVPTVTTMASDAAYVLGHTTNEEKRLLTLAQLLYPSTKNLFQQAGITTGMKVLDLGSGVGDVALLLAELVGPTGSVTGVDIYPGSLEIARLRAESAGLSNISFITGDIHQLALNTYFDAVVTRNVLIYTTDLFQVLRVCNQHLRPGGIVALHEAEWSITKQIAEMNQMPSLIRQALTWIADGFRQAGTEMQIGFKLPAAFLNAGLPLPEMQIDGIVSTKANWIGYDLFTGALRDILPKLLEYGILTEKIDADAYVELMRAEASQQHCFLPLFFMVGAWAQKA